MVKLIDVYPDDYPNPESNPGNMHKGAKAQRLTKYKSIKSNSLLNFVSLRLRGTTITNPDYP